jgi:O-antigen/teichoic acid export membrane protein
LAAAALAEIVSFTALCAFMIFSLTPGPRNRSIHLSEVGLAAIGYAGVLSLMSIDTIAARHWLGGAGSGYYAAASGAGSIAYFLAANAGTAFLPDVAKGAHEQNRRSFLIGLVEVSLLACGSAVLLILGGPIVLRILFGSGYQAARFPLYWLSASYAALGITAYLVTHHLAHRSTAILLTWIGPVILLVALFLAHRTVVEIAVDALVSSGSLLFIMATSSASLERGVSRQRRARATSEVLDAT